MTRVAFYARYSSDQQSVASIEDQLRVCRERAERIFRECASSKSARAIARDLNAEGIVGPSGRAWSDTSIRRE